MSIFSLNSSFPLLPLLIHRLVSSYRRWRLSTEVAEDPVFEDGIDEYGESGDEERVKLGIFGNS